MLCYLSDEELVEFLHKVVKNGLKRSKDKKKSGLLIIKENIRRREVLVDDIDNSITRTGK